jgi:predicted ATPase
MCVPFYSSCLAMAYARFGQFDEAQRSVREAIAATEGTKERWFEAEIHRTAGEIALKSPLLGKAEAAMRFKTALSIARDQGTKSWELRAAMSLARLWRDQGRQEEARELLGTVYGCFSEGFETLDLREADALLNTLRS